jgi:hypothetical protein
VTHECDAAIMRAGGLFGIRSRVEGGTRVPLLNDHLIVATSYVVIRSVVILEAFEAGKRAVIRFSGVVGEGEYLIQPTWVQLLSNNRAPLARYYDGVDGTVGAFF